MSPIEDLKIAYRGLGSSGFQDIRILLLEGVHESAMKLFQSAGFHVDNQSGALSEGDLMSTLKVGRYNILGVRYFFIQ